VPVWADTGGTDGEVVVALGFKVLIQKDLLARDGGLFVEHWGVPVVRSRYRASAVHAVLLALQAAAVVPPVPAAQRDREVGFLGAGLDLIEDPLPQRFLIGGHLVDVGVLRLEVCDDLWIGLIAHPLIGVQENVVVVDSFGIDALGRRSGGLSAAHGCTPIQSTNLNPEILS
jgi:hypothetical protein